MNMQVLVALLAVSGTLFSSAVQASSITYEVRGITDNSFSDYQVGWASQSSSVVSSPLTSFTNVFGGNSSYDHLSVSFSVSANHAGENVVFQIAPDAGYGGALYLNGTPLQTKTNDNLWWNYSWTEPELLTGGLVLAAGTYTLDAYWAEDCCNGGQSARFSVNGVWQELSVSNLDQLAVPEPGILALLGLGFAGLGFMRRKSA